MHATRVRHNQNDRRGSVVTEVAMTITLGMLLVAVITDASAAWRVKQVLQTAVREGARLASDVPGLQINDAGILSVVDNVARQSWPELRTCVTLHTCTRTVSFTSPLKAGDPVTVRFVFDYQPVILGMIPNENATIRLTSSSTIRYETRGRPSSLGQLPPAAPQ